MWISMIRYDSPSYDHVADTWLTRDTVASNHFHFSTSSTHATLHINSIHANMKKINSTLS